MRVTREMVERACVAIDGPDWREFNASLFWSAQAALEAAVGNNAIPVVQDALILARNTARGWGDEARDAELSALLGEES